MAIPSVKLNYKIRYRIQGFDQEFETQSYSEDEIDSQKNDIAGFEGVYGVYTLPVHCDDDQEAIG